MNKKFEYNKTIFYVAAFMLILILLIFLFLIRNIEDWKNVTYIIFFFILVVVIMTILLIVSYHEVTEKNIFIRVGLFFRGKIPFENIKSISKIDIKPFRFGFGIYFSPFKSQIFIITLNDNLVSIKLKNSQRFGWGAFGKKANEIVLNVNKSNEFVDTVLKKIRAPAEKKQKE